MKIRQLMIALSLTAAGAGASAQQGFYGVPAQLPTPGGFLRIGSVQRADGARTYYSIAATNGQHMTYAPIFGEYEFVDDVLGFPNTVMVLASGTDPAEYPTDPYDRDYYYRALFRLNLDGSLDKSFNGTGRVVFALPVNAPFVGPFTLDGIYEKGDIYIYNKDGQELLRIDGSGGIHNNAIVPSTSQVTQMGFVSLIEYRNGREQFFLSGDPGEYSQLDSLESPGWNRTGYAFHAYPAGTTKGVAICRFYGGPDPTRRSHFFTADPAECDALANDPSHSWGLETREAFRLDVPDHVTGACPGGQKPIYRFLAPRADATHRFTASEDTRSSLLAAGWIAEGYGPKPIALCAAP